jgi:hypothetical protein
MTGGMSGYDDDDENEAEQNEDPDPSDQDPDYDDGATATDACPHCGKHIYEAAEFCHHCGKYVSQEDAPARHPMWYNIGVVLCVLILLGALLTYLGSLVFS